jgi:predicted MPP superfamily phosphohydrolase
MRLSRLASTVIGLTVLGLGVWAFWIEPAGLGNEDYDLTLDTWPSQCDGFRVAVLADLHVGSPHQGLEALEETIELTERAQPDLVLVAGDLVIHNVIGGTFVSPEASAAVIGRLSAPVFAVLGNHDWWLDPVRVRAALEAEGIPVLDDTARELVFESCRFWLAGVSDYWEGPHDIDAALAEIPPGAPTILFTHNPDIFPRIPDRVAITFAAILMAGRCICLELADPSCHRVSANVTRSATS